MACRYVTVRGVRFRKSFRNGYDKRRIWPRSIGPGVPSLKAVSANFENLEAGANIDDIMAWFDGLDREQVKAVIEFAARSLDKAPEHTPVR